MHSKQWKFRTKHEVKKVEMNGPKGYESDYSAR